MNKISRLKELTSLLHKASYAYYAKDNPIMSDKQYDDLYDELLELENEIGCVIIGSPTQKVQGYVIDSLKKVKHSKPMLSANKTKNIQEIKKFIGGNPCVMSWKEDGLTIVLRYVNGIFTQAITRGQGDVGEDVTHTMRMCNNIPMKLPFYVDIEVRGECVISWKEFERINVNLNAPYKHPRNLAAGSVRQLDAGILKDRELTFKAFELVQDDLYNKSETDIYLREQLMNISESFDYLSECGFDVVEHEYVTKDNVETLIKKYIPDKYELPVDGLIFEYNDYIYGKKLGETSHHPLNMMALKWADELYETTLMDIEWSTSKSGLINPVAIFEPVDLDGAITTRATLHNISYIENLQLGIGDTIQIYRSNMVIPKVHDNLTRSNTWELPIKCPCCGGNVEIHNENGSKTLHCTNPDCPSKLLGKLVHFCSKNAVNIEGMSEATLQLLINRRWVTSFKDLYNLKENQINLWKHHTVGFGEKSVQKLLDAIEKSRTISLSNFIYSLSIPLIGRSASKDIANFFDNDYEKFRKYGITTHYTQIDGFGESMNNSLHQWLRENHLMMELLANEFTFEKVEEKSGETSEILKNKNIVITGSLIHFKNREELQKKIEDCGGKVTNSISNNTSMLINNDIYSNSSKNVKAKKLGVKIITEDEFLKMIQGDDKL